MSTLYSTHSFATNSHSTLPGLPASHQRTSTATNGHGVRPPPRQSSSAKRHKNPPISDEELKKLNFERTTYVNGANNPRREQVGYGCKNCDFRAKQIDRVQTHPPKCTGTEKNEERMPAQQKRDIKKNGHFGVPSINNATTKKHPTLPREPASHQRTTAATTKEHDRAVVPQSFAERHSEALKAARDKYLEQSGGSSGQHHRHVGTFSQYGRPQVQTQASPSNSRVELPPIVNRAVYSPNEPQPGPYISR